MEKSIDEIYNATGITKDELKKHFSVNNISDIATYLKGKINLTTDYKENQYEADDQIKIRLGAGVKSENIPKTAEFGSKTILMSKLYHHNILSLKYKNGVNIRAFTNVKVSDKLRAIILNLLEGYKPTTANINTLSKTE